jgi:3-oxoacyl-[acyl-carrier-protein] synthase II
VALRLGGSPRRRPDVTAPKVFVAGVGAITPLGDDWAVSFEALTLGRSAIAPITTFDVTDHPCGVAASIARTFEHTEDRRLALAEIAAEEAWSAASLGSTISARVGVFIGAESGRATIATVVELARAGGGAARFDYDAFGRDARTLARSIDASSVSPAAVASKLAARYRAAGPVMTLSLACASGLAAIVEAARALRLGLCDIALCGGVGADVDPLMLVGFGRLAALSARGTSCPFDVRRDGFVVGEGAAMVVLTREPRPGCVALAGCARTLDAFHLTKPEPNGDGARRAMAGALAEAGLTRVDVIQAHGTSTVLNDEVEARAIRDVFGADTDDIFASSVKGALGHSIAGAGALGFLCALESIRSSKVIPTAGLRDPDPRCRLRHVRDVAVEAPVRTALVNAFAFGGANACAVLVGPS